MASEGFELPNVSFGPDYTAVVTGGHHGLGYELAKYLLFLGARVVITSDSPNKLKAARWRLMADLLDMKEKMPEHSDFHNPADSDVGSESDAVSSFRIETMELNMRSFTSVKNFVEKFKSRGYPLNLLVCNDAVVCVDQGYTDDGNELHLQVNYLSQLLLIIGLLPVMRKSVANIPSKTEFSPENMADDGRILLVVNKAQDSGAFSMKNIQCKTQYSAAKSFANSQLYLLMAMYALVRRHLSSSRINIFAVHNGLVDKMLKQQSNDPSNWSTVYSVGRSMGKIMKNVNKNVSVCLKMAVEPQFHGLTGTYLVGGLPVTPANQRARDPKAQEALLGFSIQCFKSFCDAEDLAALELSAAEYDIIMGVS